MPISPRKGLRLGAQKALGVTWVLHGDSLRWMDPHLKVDEDTAFSGLSGTMGHCSPVLLLPLGIRRLPLSHRLH